MNKLKILHIINNLGSGGAEKLIEEALPLMNNIKGIQANVLLLTNENNVFDKRLKGNNISVEVLPLKKMRNPLNIYYIRKYIANGNYDIVHAHLFPTLYWVSIASKLLVKNKPKFVFTEHNTHNKRREKSYFRYLEKYIYSSFNSIISISQKTQENLVSWLKVKPGELEKFIIIENGININRFLNAKPYLKSQISITFTEDIKLLCMVGSFSKQKDQSTVIKAIKNLPENIHLLLIGEGYLKEENEILSKEIGVDNRVHFLGFRDDIERIFKTVDIIVLSSNWEGFGLVAAEGMAAGKPVIASDVDGLREVVVDAGFLFEKNNSRQLSDIILQLIEYKDKYKMISQKCLNKSKTYNIERMVKEYIALYYKL